MLIYQYHYIWMVLSVITTTTIIHSFVPKLPFRHRKHTHQIKFRPQHCWPHLTTIMALFEFQPLPEISTVKFGEFTLGEVDWQIGKLLAFFRYQDYQGLGVSAGVYTPIFGNIHPYLHPERITNRTWKWWFGSDDFPFPGGPYSQVPAVNLPGCI